MRARSACGAVAKQRRTKASRAHRMTAAEAQIALDDGISAFQTEAAGILNLVVVRPTDIEALGVDAIAGSDEAMGLFVAVGRAFAGIECAPDRSPMECLSCARPLRRGRYTFVVALPSVDCPTQALTVAVCTHCATKSDAIRAKAISALRSSIWPDLRPIGPHKATGHA
jgi:hypothetical protein